MNRSRFLALLLVGAFLLLAPSMLYTVDQTEIGLVTRFGRPLANLAEPGLHIKAPWPVDAVTRLDARLLVFDNEPAEMLTLDKKNVLVDSFVVWRIADPLRFAQTVKTRLEAEARLLDLAASELGAAIGREPMAAFLAIPPETVRLGEVARTATKAVDTVARESFGIEVVDLAINGFVLPPQNRASVIDRMRAERERIATGYRAEGEEQALVIEAEAAAERERILAEAEATAKATLGKGEAEALARLAAAYRQDPELYRFLRSLEAAEKILGPGSTVVLEADSPLLEALDGGR